MNVLNAVSSIFSKPTTQVAKPVEAAPVVNPLTDRDVYRAYRRDWKDTYKALSVEIRTLKIDIKNTMRKDGYAGGDQNTLRYRQDTATGMLADLAERKATYKAARIAEAA